MAHENTEFKRQGTIGGRLFINRPDVTGNTISQPDPNTLRVDVAEGYQLSIPLVYEIIPDTKRASHARQFLLCLRGDGQSQELSLMPEKLTYNKDTMCLTLNWAYTPNNWCIIRDYVQFCMAEYLPVTTLNEARTIIVNLG